MVRELRGQHKAAAAAAVPETGRNGDWVPFVPVNRHTDTNSLIFLQAMDNVKAFPSE